MFWFYLQHLSKTFFILRKAQRDITKNVEGSSYTKVKYALFLSDFSKTGIFLIDFRKKTLKYQVACERTKTNSTKLIFAFRKICEKRLKIIYIAVKSSHDLISTLINAPWIPNVSVMMTVCLINFLSTQFLSFVWGLWIYCSFKWKKNTN